MKIYRALRPIKAMTFDLDDTFYDNRPYIQHAYATLANYLAQYYPKTAALSAGTWATIRQGFIDADPRLESDVSALRLLTLEKALANDVNDTTQRKQATQACYDVFYAARSEFKVSDDVLKLLATLAERLPLIAITNGNVDCDAVGLRPYFQDVFHASVTRPMKPHRHMFDEASQRLGIASENILHVGDNLEKDVMGAVRAGYQAAWYADDRPMNLNNETVTLLPHIELASLQELALF